MLLKGVSIFRFEDHFYQRSGLILAILVEDRLANISVNFFIIGAEDFSKFGSGSPKEHFCAIILKSGHWSMRICRLNIFLLLALAATLFSGAE